MFNKYLIPTVALSTIIGCSAGSNNSASQTCNLDYYVSTTGNDESGSGSFSKPFATIARAQHEVQNSPSRGTCPITVTIKSGTYNLTQPLVFSDNDSGTTNAPITYQAESNGEVIISGGQVINGFECSGNICNATVAELPANILPRQFYVNNQRAIRARTNLGEVVNADYLRVENGYEQIIATPISNPEFVEAVTVTQWKMMRCPVSMKSGNTLVMANPCWNNANTYPIPWNFQLLSWLENAPEFMTKPNMWYLNPNSKSIGYYKESDAIQVAVLPILEQLIIIEGSSAKPVTNLQFKNLVFAYATWLEPNSNDGYVADQSGNILKGSDYSYAPIGHQKIVYKTPGNISVSYAHNITFDSNKFIHLGAIALDLGVGSQNNTVSNNIFTDISSSAIQVGSVSESNMRPSAAQATTNNLIYNNDISYTGQDYYDSAAIYVGFTSGTTISHNNINHTPWTAVAIGWGWGLFDQAGFPGLPGATYNYWGTYDSPTIASKNQIVSNLFDNFLEQLWDGGAIYANGAQGSSYEDGLFISLNVAKNKRPSAGGNIYYTDGGTSFVTLSQNVSLNNPTGTVDFGPCLTGSSIPELCLATGLVDYGADMGGCLPVGNLTYNSNYFANTIEFFGPNLCSNEYIPPYPINLQFINNVPTTSVTQVPTWIMNQAGIEKN